MRNFFLKKLFLEDQEPTNISPNLCIGINEVLELVLKIIQVRGIAIFLIFRIRDIILKIRILGWCQSFKISDIVCIVYFILIKLLK